MSERKRVAVTMDFVKENQRVLQEAFAESCEFVFVNRFSKEEVLKQTYEGAEIIFGEPEIAHVKDSNCLKWIQMSFAGTDKYTLHKQEYPKQVLLTNASGAFGAQMAEYAIGAILQNYRNFHGYYENMKASKWEDLQGGRESSDYLSEGTLEGKTVLILGCGDIGKNTAIRLKAFGTTNLGIRRKPECSVEGFDELYGLEDIDGLLPRVDILIGCIPNGQGTMGLLTEERLRRMKKNSVLLNMGRGQLIDTEGLLRVMEEGWFRFVCLDVFENEPVEKDHPLWKMDRLLMTPHVAGSSFGHSPLTEKKVLDLCIRNLSRYLQGEKLENIIDMN